MIDYERIEYYELRDEVRKEGNEGVGMVSLIELFASRAMPETLHVLSEVSPQR